MSRAHIWLSSLLLATTLPSQELLWSSYSVPNSYPYMAKSFGDFNLDGNADLLAVYFANVGTLQETETFRILSGSTGAVLQDRPAPHHPLDMEGVGDFDLDGYPDYASTFDGQGLGYDDVEVWSPHRGQLLLRVTGSRADQFGGAIAGNVDLDGDGLPDLVVGSTHPNGAAVYAFDHSGAQLWRILTRPLNIRVFDVLGLQDLDGDGCNEVLVGAVDYSLGYNRGLLAIISGRTGVAIRLHFDQLLGDLIGYPIASAGDMDRDGIEDYATSNFWGGSISGREVLTVYSGATGAVIREWQVPNYDLATRIVGGRDADLDGVVDVIAGSRGYPNVGSAQGRVQVFSARDQQLLLYTQAPPNTWLPSYADNLTDLGVQLDSPYPVFALTHVPQSPFGGIQVWRCTPRGVQHTGSACSSVGPAPSIGVRRTETTSGELSRIVLGSAPPGALAWCFVAAANSLTLDGSTLPLALDPIGFPGCALLVPPTLSDTRLVGSAGFDRGYAGIDLPVPLAAIGFHAAAQWLVLDFATGAFAASPRCEFRVP